MTPKSHSFSLGNFAKQIAKRILWQSKLPSRRQRKRQTWGVNSFGFQGVSNTRSPPRREARQGQKRSQVRGVNSLFVPPKVNAKPPSPKAKIKKKNMVRGVNSFSEKAQAIMRSPCKKPAKKTAKQEEKAVGRGTKRYHPPCLDTWA